MGEVDPAVDDGDERPVAGGLAPGPGVSQGGDRPLVRRQRLAVGGGRQQVEIDVGHHLGAGGDLVGGDEAPPQHGGAGGGLGARRLPDDHGLAGGRGSQERDQQEGECDHQGRVSGRIRLAAIDGRANDSSRAPGGGTINSPWLRTPGSHGRSGWR